jgi:hypothetical protein
MDISEVRNAENYRFHVRHPWEQTRARIISFLIKKHHPGEVKNIADIGSGDGYVASYLSAKNRKTKIHLVDTAYNSELVSMLQQKINSPKILFYDSSDQVAEAKADRMEVVLMLDVLEHLQQPETLLQTTRSKESMQTALWIITLPAYNFVFSEHDRKLGHYKRYNCRSVARLLNENGLDVKLAGYFFFSALLLRVMQKAGEKLNLKISGGNISDWKGSAFFSSILNNILWMDFSIGYFFSKRGIRLPGLSCYIICQPKP